MSMSNLATSDKVRFPVFMDHGPRGSGPDAARRRSGQRHNSIAFTARHNEKADQCAQPNEHAAMRKTTSSWFFHGIHYSRRHAPPAHSNTDSRSLRGPATVV